MAVAIESRASVAYATQSNFDESRALTLPAAAASARGVMLIAEGSGFRFRDDGTNASNGGGGGDPVSGAKVAEGDPLTWWGDLTLLRIIGSTPGSSPLVHAYFLP